MRKLKQIQLKPIILLYMCMLAATVNSFATGTNAYGFEFNINRLNEQLVALEWAGDYSKLRVAEFELYKSNDGLQFEVMTRLNFNPDMPVPFYHYLDTTNTQAYYMIKVIGLDGNVVLSDKEYIGPALNPVDFNQYALPGIEANKKIELEFEEVQKDTPAQLKVVDENGKAVMTFNSLVTPEDKTIELDLSLAKLEGIHTLLISIDEEFPVNMPQIIFK